MIVKTISNLVHKYPVIIYCLLTFSITWGLKYGYALVRTENYIPPFNFSLIAQFCPSISAIILISFTERIEGLRRIGKSIINWHVNPRWIAFAFSFEPIIFLSIALFYRLRNYDIHFAGEFDLAAGVASYLLTFIFGLFRWGLAEEIGWRGWMLPKLQNRMSPFMATIILSVVITLWHIHPTTFPQLAVPQEGGNIRGNYPEVVERLIISFPICLVTTFIFNKSVGSLLVMIIYHSASNTSYFWVADTLGIVQTEFYKTSFLVAIILVGLVFSILVIKQKEKVVL